MNDYVVKDIFISGTIMQQMSQANQPPEITPLCHKIANRNCALFAVGNNNARIDLFILSYE